MGLMGLMGLMGGKSARGDLHLWGREFRAERGVHSAFRVIRCASCDTRLTSCCLECSRLLCPLNPVGNFLQVGFLPGADDLQPFLGLSVGSN